jgi:hypothetical protein
MNLDGEKLYTKIVDLGEPYNCIVKMFSFGIMLKLK